MKPLKTALGTVLDVHIKPNSRENKIVFEKNEVVVFRRETPEKCKVNRALINELSGLFRARVDILSGFASRQKKILIRNAGPEEVCKILALLESNAEIQTTKMNDRTTGIDQK